ncbi:MAG: alkaline phosphatase PhoX, partial [Pseudomonadota bacterium]
MKDQVDHGLSMDDWDEVNNPRPETSDFDRVVDDALSRRGFLSGAVAFGSGAAVMGTGTLLSTTSAKAQAASRFAFTPIGIATDATIHVPEGYSWSVVARWGDALTSDAEAFDPATGHSAANASKVFGENTDGMWLFNIDGHEVMAVNNEYANRKTNLPATEGVPQNLEDVQLLQGIQGVTVFEVAAKDDGSYGIVVDSPFNRRIDHNTPMEITGPAAGHDLMKTTDDPTGTQSLGTLNNCGSGPTPWGTYLTCEENFNGYFGST